MHSLRIVPPHMRMCTPAPITRWSHVAHPCIAPNRPPTWIWAPPHPTDPHRASAPTRHRRLVCVARFNVSHEALCREGSDIERKGRTQRKHPVRNSNPNYPTAIPELPNSDVLAHTLAWGWWGWHWGFHQDDGSSLLPIASYGCLRGRADGSGE
jgi:hypothetical protein